MAFIRYWDAAAKNEVQNSNVDKIKRRHPFKEEYVTKKHIEDAYALRIKNGKLGFAATLLPIAAITAANICLPKTGKTAMSVYEVGGLLIALGVYFFITNLWKVARLVDVSQEELAETLKKQKEDENVILSPQGTERITAYVSKNNDNCIAACQNADWDRHIHRVKKYGIFNENLNWDAIVKEHRNYRFRQSALGFGLAFAGVAAYFSAPEYIPYKICQLTVMSLGVFCIAAGMLLLAKESRWGSTNQLTPEDVAHASELVPEHQSLLSRAT